MSKAVAHQVEECLLFLSHHVKPGAMRALDQVTAECRGRFDVFPVFDQTHDQFPIEGVSPSAMRVTAAELEAALPYPRKCTQHPGTLWPRNIDLPLMGLFKTKPDYAYYWVIEYDVRYSGNWADFFRKFDGNQSDLLAMTMFDFTFRPTWAHWKTFESAVFTPLADRVRATLSFYRLSNRALAALHKAYCDGASGHYEVAIPTLLKQAGMTIEDIGGDGAYVAPGNRNRFYTNSPLNPGLAPGTFVLHAEGMVKGPIPDMLWNPVKD